MHDEVLSLILMNTYRALNKEIFHSLYNYIINLIILWAFNEMATMIMQIHTYKYQLGIICKTDVASYIDKNENLQG